MIQLIYGSTVKVPMTDDELVELLRKSREKNEKLGITGMLLYRNNNFLQVLEGTEDAVQSLYETIARDDRHVSVMKIAQRKIPARFFPDWKMGFVNLEKDELAKEPGFSDFLMRPGDLDHMFRNPSIAYIFLNTFKNHVR